MKMDLRTPQQRLEERLKEMEDKLDKVLEIVKAKEVETTVEAKETVDKKSKKVDK